MLTDHLSACRTLSSAEELSKGVKNAKPISVDVNDEKALDAAVANHDLVISLIPYTYHATVIKRWVELKNSCECMLTFVQRHQKQEACCHHQLCFAGHA